jgi:tetratricopeptide (TPR) repeat protein
VIRSSNFRRAALAVIAAFTVTVPGLLESQAQEPSRANRVSVSGNYLAARHATLHKDATAAATYYRAALRRDPRNPDLLGQTFIAVLLSGDVEDAVKLAERVVQLNKEDRVARLVLGVSALKKKQYVTARQQLAQSIRGPVTDLAAVLLSAWTQTGPDARRAIDSIGKLTGPDWYAIFQDLHAGLILDLSGQRKEAGKHYERVSKVDGTALRIVQAYGSWLSRSGNQDEALAVYQKFDQALPRHPLIVQAMADLKAGKKLPLMVDGTLSGAAEVLYGLGAAIGRRGGEELGLVYLQLALYLAPSHPLALMSLADLYEAMKKPEMAVKVYERVPSNSPLYRNAQVQRALNLDGLERTDEAKTRLRELLTEEPTDAEAIMALGNILRVRKEFNECAEVYSRSIATITKAERPHWVIYYFRGICHERAKKWPEAEADLKKSLELFPDQPQVLNYLGYSWVDQGVNLDEGMKMIRRAVEQRPDDGYIVDSLGWAHYRLGEYQDALKHLEQAVSLRPEDPTINDHLGDVYWKVGRRLEATFQWRHARDLKPEPEDLPKILEKLKSGLPDDPSPSAKADKEKKPGGG